MQRVRVSDRAQWRAWLLVNHDRVLTGIWLVFQKRHVCRSSLSYEDAVEEALCFGWIDSLVRKIDKNTYCRKFTPRRNTSVWSSLNRKRVEKVINEGRMTAFGLAKVEAAKVSGRWEKDSRPPVTTKTPSELKTALSRNQRAKDIFESLPPSCRRQYIGWIVSAKKPETKEKRIKESLTLLEEGRKLGMK